MPRVAGVTTALPVHALTQEHIKDFAKTIFCKNRSFLHLLPVFDNAQVKRRYFIKGLDWFESNHDFTETNDVYIKSALDLCEKAIVTLAEQCELRMTDFDVVFLISTTGLSTPSLDARLFNRVKFSPHIKRIPIWGLGCAGGAAGLARAYDYLKAYPTHRALIVAVELCGLSFQKNDFSKSNIISTALFADGAAACLVAGDKVKLPPARIAQPSICGSFSTIYPDSLEVMSWRVTTEGFRVQLSRDIPTIVHDLVKDNVNEFLTQNELSLDSIEHFVMHPGGINVLRAYAESLGLPMARLDESVFVLENFGNLSSVTILFILKRFLEKTRNKSGEYGLCSALGPGFSSELVLLKWD